MDVRSKQKSKKKRTRRNLDDLRKKSRKALISNLNAASENTLEFKKIAKYNNNLISYKRLTLEFFKKTIKSKTITRAPLCKIDHYGNIYNTHNRKVTMNTLANNSCPLQESYNYISKSSMTCENDIEVRLKSPNSERLLKMTASGNYSHEQARLDSVISCNTLPDKLEEFEDVTSEINFDNFKYRRESITFSSSSEVESSSCAYLKFMNDLPSYLKSHFPGKNSSFMNKNIATLRKNCLQSDYYKKNNKPFSSMRTNVDSPQNHKQIIQNPRAYIQTGFSWDQSMQEQNVLVSNSSSPSVSEPKTSDIFLNSPDYQYFPHKLNQ